MSRPMPATGREPTSSSSASNCRKNPATLPWVMHAFAAAAAAILLGIHGDPTRFQNQTGQASQIRHTFVSFAQTSSLLQIAANAGPVPMLALNAGAYGAHVTATPRGLATGQNDAF